MSNMVRDPRKLIPSLFSRSTAPEVLLEAHRALTSANQGLSKLEKEYLETNGKFRNNLLESAARSKGNPGKYKSLGDITANVLSSRVPFDLPNGKAYSFTTKKSNLNGFDFKTIPAHPSSRETVMAAFEDARFAIVNESMSTDHAGTFQDCYDSFKFAEWFDFGRLNADDIASASFDAMPLFKEGMLRSPYERCVFRCRLVHEDTELESIMLIDQSETQTTIMQFRCNGLRNEYVSLLAGVVLRGTDVKGIGKVNEKQQADFSLMLFHEYLGLWTMLNARGVGKVVEEPSEKLNRARARNNKAPLQRVIKVDAARYVTALHETVRMESSGSGATGTGRSPKMHLRRGHMRTYTHDRFAALPSDRRIKWIRPMIINGTGDVDKNRDAYIVRVK
jgi:hypothetical protein